MICSYGCRYIFQQCRIAHCYNLPTQLPRQALPYVQRPVKSRLRCRQDIANLLGQTLWVTRNGPHIHLAIQKNISNYGHITHNDWTATGNCLDGHQPQSLPITRDCIHERRNEHGCSSIELRQGVLGHGTTKLDAILQPQLGNQSGQFGQLRSTTDYHKMRTGHPLADLRKGLNQVLDPLFLDQAADEQDLSGNPFYSRVQ